MSVRRFLEAFTIHILCLFSTFRISSSSGFPEPSFSAPLQNITVIAGREARIACMVENLQNYKVAWVHYGDRGSAVLSVSTHVLTTNRRVAVVAERDAWTLVIANATVADRGEYMCQISTVPPQKIYASLEVLVPPQITHPPVDITVNEGENATLECGATGDPKPNITWRREGDATPYKDDLADSEEDGAYLTFFFVTRATAGAFLCVASNGVPPAVSGRALLQIKYGPIAIGSDESVTWAVVGGRTNLQCRFEAFPRPQVTWSAFGKPIRSGIQIETNLHSSHEIISKLIIVQVSQIDFGMFKCEAKNDVGEAYIFHQLIEHVITTTTTSTTSTTSTSTKELITRPQAASVKGNDILWVDLEGINQTKLEKPFFEKTVRERKEEDAIFLVDGIDPNKEIPPKKGVASKELKASSLNRFIQESPFDKLFQFASYSNSDARQNIPSTHLLSLCLGSAVGFWVKLIVIKLR